MSNVVRWFKSGGVVLSNFRPLMDEDGVEHRNDHVEEHEQLEVMESGSPKAKPGNERLAVHTKWALY